LRKIIMENKCAGDDPKKKLCLKYIPVLNVEMKWKFGPMKPRVSVRPVAG
jgi:hypothetical protein